jgi:hypothetical protein
MPQSPRLLKKELLEGNSSVTTEFD